MDTLHGGSHNTKREKVVGNNRQGFPQNQWQDFATSYQRGLSQPNTKANLGETFSSYEMIKGVDEDCMSIAIRAVSGDLQRNFGKIDHRKY